MNSNASIMDKIMIKNDHVVLREEFDDWALLFDPDTGNVCGLNPVGVFIWKLIDGSRTVNDIFQCVSNECPDAPDSAQEEVCSFIQGICEKGYANFCN